MDQEKRKKNKFSIELKLNVIKFVENGHSVSQAAKMFNASISAILLWVKNKDDLVNKFNNNSKQVNTSELSTNLLNNTNEKDMNFDYLDQVIDDVTKNSLTKANLNSPIKIKKSPKIKIETKSKQKQVPNTETSFNVENSKNSNSDKSDLFNNVNMTDSEYYKKIFGENIGPMNNYRDFLILENREKEFYLQEYKIFIEIYRINMEITEKLIEKNETIKDKSSPEGLEIQKQMEEHEKMLQSNFFQMITNKCIELTKILFE